MSEYADKHSNPHRKERVEHILRVDPKAKIDASGYTPPDALNADIKTGARPVPRKFKKGGKIEGGEAHHHAGRKSRDAGGQMAAQQLRPQVPTGGLYGQGFSPTHPGQMAIAAGIKKGGAVKDVTGVRVTGGRKARAEGGRAEDKFKKGDSVQDIYGNKTVVTNVKHPMVYTEKNPNNSVGEGVHHTKVFPITARASGGRAKGKTNINIIIGGPKESGAGQVPPPPSAMPPGRPALPPAALGAMTGPMGGPPGMPPGGPGGGGPPPMLPPGMGPK